jgi:hypothetical protein
MKMILPDDFCHNRILKSNEQKTKATHIPCALPVSDYLSLFDAIIATIITYNINKQGAS